MTVGFVRATKAYLLPAVLEDVFSFRKAFLTSNGVLRSLFNAISTTNGTATAISTLRGSYYDTSVDCQGFQPIDYPSACPWGLLSFVESAASSLGVTGNITEAEVSCIAEVQVVRKAPQVTQEIAGKPSTRDYFHYAPPSCFGMRW